jgi:phospholipase/carboxylesterase
LNGFKNVPAATDPQQLAFNDWTFRLRMPQGQPKSLLVLLHGWMGDENSMSILARNLLPEIALLSPRGIFAVPEGGYSWREIRPGTWGLATLEDFRPAADALVAFLDTWAASTGLDVAQFDLMGFSQGAALTYTLALLYPQRFRRAAALCGFIPEGGQALLASRRISGKPVFVSHGRQDETIPVEQSRTAVALLQQAGALVTYCESDTGHRISKECLKKMERFLGED